MTQQTGDTPSPPKSPYQSRTNRFNAAILAVVSAFIAVYSQSVELQQYIAALPEPWRTLIPVTPLLITAATNIYLRQITSEPVKPLLARGDE